MLLENKTAVVTGGANNLGRAVAVRFARENANVVIFDIDEESGRQTVSAIEDAGGKAEFIRGDVTDPEQIEEAVSDVLRKYGRIDILVNGASVWDKVPMADCTLEQWDRVMNVNFTGTVMFCKAVLPSMVENKAGKIINLMSMAAYRGRKGQEAYCSSQGALHALTKTLGFQFARKGICVNAIAHGLLESECTPDEDVPENLAYHARRIPARRTMKPEDIAGTAVYLACDDSDYVNSEIVVVDGGKSVFVSGSDHDDTEE